MTFKEEIQEEPAATKDKRTSPGTFLEEIREEPPPTTSAASADDPDTTSAAEDDEDDGQSVASNDPEVQKLLADDGYETLSRKSIILPRYLSCTFAQF